MFFCDFRYFLAEIEGLEQKSDSEAEEGLQMLLDSDLPELKMNFLELQCLQCACRNYPPEGW